MGFGSNEATDAAATPRDIVFAPNDAHLREDVHRLGKLVGRMLAEQGGELLFGRVEQLRRAASMGTAWKVWSRRWRKSQAPKRRA